MGASTLPGRWRGAAPPSHPVFVRGAGGHCVRARNGGPGSPPTPSPGPLGNSKTTSGVCGGSPEYSRSERPGGGLSEIRSQIRRRFPLPCLSTLKGHLNRKREREKERRGGNYTKPTPPGEFSWLPVGGGEPRGVLERGGWALGWLEAAEQREGERGRPRSGRWRKQARGQVPKLHNSCVAFWAAYQVA